MTALWPERAENCKINRKFARPMHCIRIIAVDASGYGTPWQRSMLLRCIAIPLCLLQIDEK